MLSGINVMHLILQWLWMPSGPGTDNSMWASLPSPQPMGPDWTWFPTCHLVLIVMSCVNLPLLSKSEFFYISLRPLLKIKTFYSSNIQLLAILYFEVCFFFNWTEIWCFYNVCPYSTLKTFRPRNLNFSGCVLNTCFIPPWFQQYTVH